MNKKAIIITGLLVLMALYLAFSLASLNSSDSPKMEKARNRISDILMNKAMMEESPEKSPLAKASMNLDVYNYKNGTIVAYKDIAVWYVEDTNICCLNGQTKQWIPDIDYCENITYLDIKDMLK